MSQQKNKTPELFPERRSIIRRPDNGICHFCLKIISASNWSRHIRSQHMKELVRLKQGDQSPTLSEEPLTSETPQNDGSSEYTTKLIDERHITKREEECPGEGTAMSEEGQQRTRRKNSGRRKRRATAQQQQQQQQQQQTEAAVPKRPKRSRRMCCAIRLPENNVCPLCGKTTSAGNWSRHLKRHHPEYALAEGTEETQQMGMAMCSDAAAAAVTVHQQQQQQQQQQQHQQQQQPHLHSEPKELQVLDQKVPATLQRETDFSLVHLQQFLAQQKQHNNFDAFGGLGELVAEPTIDEHQINYHPLSAIKALELKLEEPDVQAALEGTAELMKRMIGDRTLEDYREMNNGQHLTLLAEEQPTIQQRPLDGPSTSGSAIAKEPAAESTSHRQKAQRRTSAIRPDKDGRCPLCGKSISSPNWRRHLLRCHPEEELLAQYKYPDPIFSVPVQTRLFALYAATAHMPLEHLDNEFLRKFLNLMPEFDIPSRRMLQAQMDGEVERVKQRIRVALSSQKLLAASVHIEGGMVEGLMQQNSMVICAHFWDNSAQSAECVGLSLGPVGYSNDDIVDGIRDRLADMELPLERNKFIHFTVDKFSGFSNYNSTRPAFFNPFPFIGGPMATSIGLPSADWQLVDSSPEVLETFFNNDTDEDDAGEEEVVLRLGEGIDVSVCAARRLESVLRTVFERDQHMLELRKRLFLLFEQFAFSHCACSALSVRNGGVSILFPANVRWHTLEPAYARLFSLYGVIGGVCEEFKIPPIFESDWKTIEMVLEISDTFHKFVAKLEQIVQPTISLLFPGLNLLLSTLQQNFAAQMPSLTDALTEQIRHAFADVLNFECNSLFLCASMLDPQVENKVSADPNALLRVRPNIERFVDVVESPFGFGTIRRARAPLLGTAKEHGAVGEERDQIDMEIVEYLDIVQLDSSESCSEFWTKHRQRFPLLSDTAKSVLAIPATTATAKCLLRQVRDSGAERDTEIGVRKAMLKFNRRFIDLVETTMTECPSTRRAAFLSLLLRVVAVAFFYRLKYASAAVDSLDCSDFGMACHWHNAVSPPSPLLWYRSSLPIDGDQLQLMTGTNVTPNGTYAITASSVQDVSQNGTALVATLISDTVPCQINNATLSLNYWTTSFVRIWMCCNVQGQTLNRSRDCQMAPTSQGPGPAMFTIQGITEPFQISIEATNFVYTNSNSGLQGGLAILDNIGKWIKSINDKLNIGFCYKFISLYSNDSESNNDNNKATCNKWNCINKFINSNKFNKLIIGFCYKFISLYSNDSESNNDNNKATCNKWNCINKFFRPNKFKQFNKLIIGFWNKFINSNKFNKLIIGFCYKFISLYSTDSEPNNDSNKATCNKWNCINKFINSNKFKLIFGFWNKFISLYSNDSESNNDNNKATCNKWNCINKFINSNKFNKLIIGFCYKFTNSNKFNKLIIGICANERHYDGKTGKCHVAVSTSNGPNKLHFGQQLEGQSGRRCDSVRWGGGKCERQFVRLKFFKSHHANFCRFNGHNDDEAANNSQWHFCANKFNRRKCNKCFFQFVL
uniref:C2H2-type domain-containing protein n=1 Tax=Globodera pallida TaxID=36090 RepID=A0A183BZ30_GLOPA